MIKKNIVRIDFEGKKKKMTYEDMREELIFQIKEDITTTEMYKEYLMEDVEKPLSFNEYCQEVLQMKLQQINDGYCVEIMGDSYFIEE